MRVSSPGALNSTLLYYLSHLVKMHLAFPPPPPGSMRFKLPAKQLKKLDSETTSPVDSGRGVKKGLFSLKTIVPRVQVAREKKTSS